MKLQRKAIAGLALSASALVALSNALSNWCRQRFLHRPFQKMDAVVNPLVANSSDFRPFHWCQRPSIVLKQDNATLVPPLFSRSGPFAVIWGVVSRGIDSVNRVLRAWGQSHVSEEIHKIKPPITNAYPRPKVQIKVIRRSPWTTPLFHQRPSVVFLCAPPIVRVCALPVLKVCLATYFFLKTTTRFCVSVWEFIGGHNNASPAIAKAVPASSFSQVVSPVYHKQPGKSLACSINEFWHFVTLKWFTVMGAWQSAVNSFSGATLAKPVYFTRGCV